MEWLGKLDVTIRGVLQQWWPTTFTTDKINVGSVRLRSCDVDKRDDRGHVAVDGVVVDGFHDHASLKNEIYTRLVEQNDAHNQHVIECQVKALRDGGSLETVRRVGTLARIFHEPVFDTSRFTPNDIQIQTVDYNWMHAWFCHSNPIYNRTNDVPRYVWGVEACLPSSAIVSKKME